MVIFLKKREFHAIYAEEKEKHTSPKKQFWIVLRKFSAKSVQKITVGQVMGWSRS